jgi:thiamine-phosphate pyrophosphorylase
MMPDLSVYLVTDVAQSAAAGRDLVDTVLAAVRGGVTTVQLRAKDAEAAEMLQLAEELARRLPTHVDVLVNDRVDVYLAARARGARVAGVHVGQRDLPPVAVREMVGPDAVIGLSASSRAQIAEAASGAGRVTYLGIGAVHQTSSKPDAPPVLGIAAAGHLASVSSLPAVAIGGVTPEDVPALRAAGFAGAAVVSWICAAPDARAAAAELARAWATPEHR